LDLRGLAEDDVRTQLSQVVDVGVADDRARRRHSSVAVWESTQHADRFLEDRLAPALTSAFDEPEGRPEPADGRMRAAG